MTDTKGDRNMEKFKDALCDLINKHSLEGESGTPDYVLADYLCDCLEAWNRASQQKDWHEGERGGE